MLKSSDMVREFPVVTKTDRDVEVPLLIEYIYKIKPESLLDVGAHWSHAYYAKLIRPFIKRYDAVDILSDPETEKIVDTYYVGNAITLPLKSYDMVICVSTLEHAGLSTYTANHEEEVPKLFYQCFLLAKKYLWFSFPVGQKYFNPTEMAPITGDQIEGFENILEANNCKYEERFFYNKSVTDGFPWQEHTKRDVALKIPYIDCVGTQSLCVITAEK